MPNLICLFIYMTGDSLRYCPMQHAITTLYKSYVNHSGYGKREANINCPMETSKGNTRYWNYLQGYWPCAGGLSAVNTIGTRLRDLVNVGLTRWRLAVYINGCHRGNREESRKLSTRFSLSVENEQADAGRDGRTRLFAKPNSQAVVRTGTGKKQVSLSR